MTDKDPHPFGGLTDRKKTLEEAHQESYVVTAFALVFLFVLVFGSWLLKWLGWL